MMRIAMVVTPFTESNLRLAAQVGVTDIVGRYPPTLSLTIGQLKQRVEAAGMQLTVFEGYIPHDQIVHGRPGRDEQIELWTSLIKDLGKAAVEVICYNFIPDGDWSRTSVTQPQRGGALVTGFDIDTFKRPTSETVSREQLWDNLEYFLKRIIPVAENAGIKLAMHPDDPPMGSLAGQDQIISSVEGFDRLFQISSSPVNGMCFCQGTFAEMGVSIPETIAYFGDHIHFVHFRDVDGTVPRFAETFHDNGITDMAAAIRAYRSIGFDGPMRPDHVPVLEGETTENSGYTMLGRLFAVGYMKGLMEATANGA